MVEKAILSLETSQSLCSACVYFNEDNFYQMKINLKNSHSEKIFETINDVMKSAEVSFNDLDAIAFSSGPGSFTGLRIGISAAKGLAYASGLPLISVPTFEALASQISEYLPEGSDFIIANKVNMEEVYYARFKVTHNKFIFTENLEIISRKSLNLAIAGVVYFGNAVQPGVFDAPDALFVAKYAKDNSLALIRDFDTLEPFYIKSFTFKERHK